MDLGKLLPTICLVVLALAREPGWTQTVPASAPASDDGVVCTLYTDKLTLRADEPLLTLAILENRASVPIPFEQPFDYGHGMLGIMVRGDSGGKWREVRSPMSGMLQAFGGEHAILPGQSQASYTLVLYELGSPSPHEGRFVFEEAGTYQVRARVRYRCGEFFSAPVTVQVTPMSEKAQAFKAWLNQRVDPENEWPDREREMVRAILSALGPTSGGWSLDGQGRAQRIQAQLADSAGWRCLRSMGEGKSRLYSRTTEDDETGWAMLEELKKSGGPLWTDLATEVQAIYRARLRQHTKARELLAKVKHPTELSRQAEAIMEDHAMQLHSQPTE